MGMLGGLAAGFLGAGLLGMLFGGGMFSGGPGNTTTVTRTLVVSASSSPKSRDSWARAPSC